ncbi:MAG: hypothetical protein AAGA87_16415 [Pseudomonadota bacterium]
MSDANDTKFRARAMANGLTMLEEIGQFLEMIDRFSRRLAPEDAADLQNITTRLRQLHVELSDRSTL